MQLGLQNAIIAELHEFEKNPDAFDEVTRDPRCLLSRLDDDAVTIAELVPSMLREMLDIVETPGIEGPTLSRLRWLLVTGEALPPEVCRRWFRLYPRHPLMNAYGPTECSDDVTHAVLRDALPADKASVPIGRALINTTLHVLDARMMPVPVGVWGELYVGGAGVGRGYLQRPEETVRAFLADPSNPLERWYRTGDRVRWLRDGSLEYQGRLDHQVKIRGFRIELGEIEAVLAQHTEVSGAIVVARDDGFGGQKRLVAYVTPLARRPSIQQLKDFVRARLPQHMVPSAIVVLDVFPVTQAGKVDRHALPAPRAESLERSRNASSTLASDLEQAIAGLWSEYLGAVAIGREDNFFELGGHSLLMPRIQIGLAKLLERDVKLTDLFEHPTVASLAQHLSGAKQEQETTVADTKQSWRDEPIAVIGFAGRFPGAPDVETLWDNLRTGREGIRFFSRQETLAAQADRVAEWNKILAA